MITRISLDLALRQDALQRSAAIPASYTQARWITSEHAGRCIDMYVSNALNSACAEATMFADTQVLGDAALSPPRSGRGFRPITVSIARSAAPVSMSWCWRARARWSVQNQTALRGCPARSWLAIGRLSCIFALSVGPKDTRVNGRGRHLARR